MKHILLIEDETDHADLIQRALADIKKPYKVSWVENLAAARALAAQQLPDLAQVQLDLVRRMFRLFVHESGPINHGIGADAKRVARESSFFTSDESAGRARHFLTRCGGNL